MSVSDDRCLNVLMAAGKGLIDRELAESMLSKVQETIAKRAGVDGTVKATMDAISEALTKDSVNAARARLSALENETKATLNAKQNVRDVENLVNVRGRKAGDIKGADLFDSMRSFLHGINTVIAGGRQSLESAINGMLKDMRGGFNNDLEQTGLAKLAQSGKFDEDVWHEMAEMEKGKQGLKGRPGLTNNEYALKLADVMHSYVALCQDRMNKAGANIRDLFGYVIQQTHDWEKIRDLGKTDWQALVEKHFGQKSFDGMDKIQKQSFLDQLYNSFVSGEHLGPMGSGKGANIGRIAGEERHLIPNDADAAYQYFKACGKGNTILDAVGTTIDRTARNAPLMNSLGTVPEEGFRRLENDMLQHFSQVNPEAVREYKDKYQTPVANRWKEINGTMDLPKNRILKNIGVGARVFETIAHLGNVVFAHTSVPVTRAMEYSHWGDSKLTSYRTVLSDLVTKGGALDASKHDMLKDLGALNDAMISHHLSFYGDNFDGKASAIVNSYMKLTGLPYVMEGNKISSEVLISQLLGRNLGKGFEELHPDTASSLSTYGIGKEEWEMLRKVAPTHEGHLTPDMGDRLDDASVKAILSKSGAVAPTTSESGVASAIEKYKDNFTNNLSAMFSDTARRAINMPGAETRAILYQGTRSGSLQGELMRALTMFKQWPTELLINTLGREIYSNKTTGAKMLGLFHLASALTAAGYLRIALTDLTSGYTPPAPDNLKTIMASAEKGGAGMVFGDMLGGMAAQSAYAKTPRDIAQGAAISLLGPQIGTAISVGAAAVGAVQHHNPGKQALDFALHNIPGQNLFYTKLATNYLFLWSLHDMIHPGWSQNYENSIKRETGNKPFIGPVKK